MSNRRLAFSLISLIVFGGCSSGVIGDEQGQPEPPHFEDVASEVGVDYRGMTFALAAGDIEGEGWPDLFLTNHHQVVWMRNTLGEFDEPAFLSGNVEFDVHGMSWLDYDLDLRPDLFVTVGANRGFGRGDNRLFLNRNDGVFENFNGLDETMRDALGRGRCTVIRDFDHDGWADIALMNAVQKDRMHHFFRGGPTGFEDITEASGIENIGAACMAAVHLAPEEEAYFVGYGSGEHSGHIFRFQGERFVDVSESMGMTWRGTAHAVLSGDYDNDGDLDLYYIRGHGNPTNYESVSSKSVLLRLLSRKKGQKVGLKFRCTGTVEIKLEIAGPGGPEIIRIGPDGFSPPRIPFEVDLEKLAHGAPIREYDEAGISVWNDGEGFANLEILGDGRRIRFVGGEISSDSPIDDLELTGAFVEFRGQPNALFNYHEGRFRNVTEVAGVQDLSSGRDGAFFDADNDGDIDLYLVNSGTAIRNLPDSFFLNNGDGTFTDFTEEAGIVGPVEGRGQSIVACDIDRNGTLELYTANGDGPWPGNDGPVVIWRNSSRVGNWAALDLRGCGRDYLALGTRVVVSGVNGRLALQHDSTMSRFTTSILPLHIGMGSDEGVDVEVHWRTGLTEEVSLDAGEVRQLIAPWCRESDP